LLSFGDTLTVDSLKERSVCDLRMPGDVPQEHNSIYKALAAFRAKTGFDGGVRCVVEKRLPMGAGLGGGSSDAASALMAFDAIAGTRLPATELEEIALSVGSDVPFFIRGGTAVVSGRGEVIEPVSTDLSYAVVLVHPGFTSGTVDAYRTLDRSRSGDLLPTPLGRETLLRSLAGSVSDWPFFNDFETVFLAAGTRESALYGALLSDLRMCGADFVSLSGSGSTCFGVFPSLKKAQKASVDLQNRWKFVELALPLARSANAGVQ
jgi:4-diphosphocytidyl-2-C-methyl-D-erythritol kinase